MSDVDKILCPVCYEKAKRKFESSYGKVDEDEYNSLKQKINDPYSEFQTMRKDLETGMKIKDDGKIVVFVVLELSCKECGFEERIKTEREVGALGDFQNG